MASLTPEGVSDLIRAVVENREVVAFSVPMASPGNDAEPPHLLWGLGGHPKAVGVTLAGLEFRVGEYWAANYGDLEVTNDPWVISGVETLVETLAESIRRAAERREQESARRVRKAKVPVEHLIIDFLSEPSPDRFKQILSDEVLWIDHRDDDEDVVARVSMALGGGVVSPRCTDDDQLMIRGPHGEQTTIDPPSRDITLRCLSTLLAPEFEMWWWIGGNPSDTIALIALPASRWRAVKAAVPSSALRAQFRRVDHRSEIFTLTTRIQSTLNTELEIFATGLDALAERLSSQADAIRVTRAWRGR